MAKVYWISRHDLSSAQQTAIRTLHGENVDVVKDPVEFSGGGLAEYIRSHVDGFVYVVARLSHCMDVALKGCSFGFFENHPQKRQDGIFGLSAVYHVYMYPTTDCLDSRRNPKTVHFGFMEKVWNNPDPTSDVGESLTPAKRS